MPTHPVLILISTVALASLSACNRADDAASVDTAGNAADPARAGSLAERIVVDPARAGRRGASAGPGVARAVPAPAGCDIRRDAAWAGRLPAELPLYPGARVAEAAGSDAAGCRRRIVSFASAASPGLVVEYYRSRAAGAGYSVEHLREGDSDVLGGTRGEAAYYITVTPAGRGSAVDLVVNTG